MVDMRTITLSVPPQEVVYLTHPALAARPLALLPARFGSCCARTDKIFVCVRAGEAAEKGRLRGGRAC